MSITLAVVLLAIESMFCAAVWTAGGPAVFCTLAVVSLVAAIALVVIGRSLDG